MNARQIEVHSFYKDMYPNALILYKLPGQYMLLGEDVDRALKSISKIQIVESGVGVLPEDITVLSKLGADGTEVRLIQYRNGSGNLDLPDVTQIKRDIEMDY